jgi:deoxyadenosine/deoxycytidine kinase
MKIISIEGNIGTGKTTFVELLKQTLSTHYPNHTVIFMKEPVDAWLNLKDDATGENILGAFYRSQERWSYSFQMNAFITRIKQTEAILKKYDVVDIDSANKRDDLILIMERCVYTDRNVFANLLRESNKISSMEWKLYDEWFQWLVTKCTHCLPTHYFYLNASADVSFIRMRKRDRNEECSISLKYLQSVEEKHNRWMELISVSQKTVWDANKDFENDSNERELLYEKINSIINSQSK